jgi:antitoxin (DNA-binding transcriptional repressor) of toxin-antitoxin stability system
MKQIVLEMTDLESCINEAQRERVVIVRNGKPIALIVGIEGLDPEQLALGSPWQKADFSRGGQSPDRTAL